MSLSNEDSLRINVMLRQKPRAVRIDESRMVVHALTDKGEARIQLNPDCREELYLRKVRELLSTHVMGSPGGYPVYIRRWTRMGQERDDDSLKNLLQLGEPEAVTAVVNTPDLSPELAELAWWALPTAEVARQLLRSPSVAQTPLGRELASYLIEFLPFEESHQAAIDSVRLALTPGLLESDQIAALWRKAKRRQSYYIGFLHAIPDDLPAQRPPHALHEAAQALAATSPQAPWPNMLARVLSASGQAFLGATEEVIHKLPNQDAAVELLEAIGGYFSAIRPDQNRYRSFEEIENRVRSALRENSADLENLQQNAPDLQPRIESCLALSMVSEYVAAPIFGHTDAIGSVMRKRLAPVTNVILDHIRTLTTSAKC